MVLDSYSNQRLWNFIECGLSNGHLKIKEAVWWIPIHPQATAGDRVEASEARVKPGASEPHREDRVWESPLVRAGQHQSGGSTERAAGELLGTGTPGEALFVRREENTVTARTTANTHGESNSSSSAESLSLTTRTLISAIIEVQSQCEDAGESVPSRAEWRAKN